MEHAVLLWTKTKDLFTVEVVAAETSEHAKAKSALPFKPAIVVE